MFVSSAADSTTHRDRTARKIRMFLLLRQSLLGVRIRSPATPLHWRDMKFGLLRIAAVSALPIVLHTAGPDLMRGFDSSAHLSEKKWEQQARAIPDTGRIGAFIEKLSSKPHLAGTVQSKETAEYIL